MNAEQIPSLDAVYAMAGPAIRDVIAERAAQVDKHGYTLEHDLDHHPVDLALSAAAYLNTAVDQLHGKEHPASAVPEEWPFCGGWKPGDARRNLVKALALGLATLDRLDNAPRDSGEAPHEIERARLADHHRATHLTRRPQ